MTNRKVILGAAGIGALFGLLGGSDTGGLQGGDAAAGLLGAALGGAFVMTTIAVVGLWVAALMRGSGRE